AAAGACAARRMTPGSGHAAGDAAAGGTCLPTRRLDCPSSWIALTRPQDAEDHAKAVVTAWIRAEPGTAWFTAARSVCRPRRSAGRAPSPPWHTAERLGLGLGIELREEVCGIEYPGRVRLVDPHFCSVKGAVMFGIGGSVRLDRACALRRSTQAG